MEVYLPSLSGARDRLPAGPYDGALQPTARCQPISLLAMPAELESILRLEVPLIVQIADRHMPAEDVLALTPGAIMELPKSADAELEILVNNKTIGLGRAVKVGENFGVRVVYVGRLEERVAALGGGEAASEVAADNADQKQPETPAEAIAEQLTTDS
jgi:flagellar motor switch protein FliN/FliY